MATPDQLLFVLTLFAALGCGLMAGVFFAFSAFVMKPFEGDNDAKYFSHHPPTLETTNVF